MKVGAVSVMDETASMRALFLARTNRFVERSIMSSSADAERLLDERSLVSSAEEDEMAAAADTISTLFCDLSARVFLDEIVPPDASPSEISPFKSRLPRVLPATMLPVTSRSLSTLPSQNPISVLSPRLILLPSVCSFNFVGWPLLCRISKSPAIVVESVYLSLFVPLLSMTKSADPATPLQAFPIAGCEWVTGRPTLPSLHRGAWITATLLPFADSRTKRAAGTIDISPSVDSRVAFSPLSMMRPLSRVREVRPSTTLPVIYRSLVSVASHAPIEVGPYSVRLPSGVTAMYASLSWAQSASTPASRAGAIARRVPVPLTMGARCATLRINRRTGPAAPPLCQFDLCAPEVRGAPAATAATGTARKRPRVLL